MYKKSRMGLTVLLTMTLVGCATPQSRMPTPTSASTDAETKKQQMLVLDDYLSNYNKRAKRSIAHCY